MDFKAFLKEETHLPIQRDIFVSKYFVEGGQIILWRVKGITESEFQRTPAKDFWAALCVASLKRPDLKDKALWESYGKRNAEDTLKEMLLPGEYLRLLQAVKEMNGFVQRKKMLKEKSKNALRRA